MDLAAYWVSHGPWAVMGGGILSAAIFLHNWKIAKATEITKEKNESWRAFHAFNPRTPKAKGINVMALRRMKTIIGTMIFFNFDFFPRASSENLTLRLSSSLSKFLAPRVTSEENGNLKVTSWLWMYSWTLSSKDCALRADTSLARNSLRITSTSSLICKKYPYY